MIYLGVVVAWLAIGVFLALGLGALSWAGRDRRAAKRGR